MKGINGEKKQQIMDINALELSTRVKRALIRANVYTIDDLLASQESGSLYSIWQIGPKSIAEIEKVLSNLPCTDPIYKGKGSAPSLVDKYRALTKLVQAEIEANRLSEDVICRHVKLQDCFTNSYNGELSDIIKINSVLDCAVKHENIYEEIKSLLIKLSDRDIHILYSRFGPHRQTLEELAKEYEITRERIRQISNRVEIRLLESNNKNWLPRTQTSIQIVKRLGKRFRYTTWKSKLNRLRLVGPKTIKLNESKIHRIDTIQLAIAIIYLINDKSNHEFIYLPEYFLYCVKKPKFSIQSIEAYRKLSSQEKRNIRRVVKNSGAIHVSDPLIKCGNSKKFDKELLKLLGYKEISDGWFSGKAKKENQGFNRYEAAANNALKILKVTEKVNICDLREGINIVASRLGYTAAPEPILGKVLELNGFTYRDEYISWPMENPIKFEGRDRIFVNLIEELGPVVTFQEICDAFEIEGLSRASAVAATQFSPLPQKISMGLYKLRGRQITPIDYKEAEERRERVPANAIYEYTIDGEIIYRTNVGTLGLGGVISVQGLPNLSGEWDCYVNDTPMGLIAVNETFIWRLSAVFDTLGICLGDRVEFRFNVWERCVYVRKLIG
jgi:hypothetical protein